MARNGAVGNFRRPFTDHQLGRYKLLSALSCSGSRDTQRATGTQASRQLTSQPAAPLYIERLVDCFMRYPHGFIIREIHVQSPADLFRAPTRAPEVILGVDTHLDVHVGVVVDAVGRVKGTLSIETNLNGYERLLAWARSFGRLSRAGIEGTGSYGAGLTRFLEQSGIAIIEINRPNRSRRRNRGKSDPTDAESAARAVLADDATGIPKAQNGMAEALRTLSLLVAAPSKPRLRP